MKEKVLKINKKDYNIAKSLSDRDFGTLVRALCEYVYYGINASPKDKILKVYYDNFKEKIDMENFFRETGRLGGIKSNELRQKAEENRSVVLDVFNVDTVDELLRIILEKSLGDCCKDDEV